jgi:hypothetical protein
MSAPKTGRIKKAAFYLKGPKNFKNRIRQKPEQKIKR